MSLSGSRRSSRPQDGEFLLECKAAFLAIYDEITDRIESKKSLNTVLQQSGRNPSKVSLNKYWPRDTDQLSFNDFVDICRKEPVTTADDLMKAFRKIDMNGDGYISLDELYKIMTAQGESMSRDEVRKMIDEVDDNKDGRLDYREFTNMIMKTTEDAKKFSMKMMEKKERRHKRGDRHASEATNNNNNVSSGKDLIKSDEMKNIKKPARPSATESSLKPVDDDTGTVTRSSMSPYGSNTSISGSRVSLKPEQGLSGSRVSLKPEQGISASRASLKPEQGLSGSRASLKPEQGLSGSRASLKSEQGISGSKASLKPEQGLSGSRASLKPEPGISGSKASLKSVRSTKEKAMSLHTNGKLSEVSGRDVLDSQEPFGSAKTETYTEQSQAAVRGTSIGSRGDLTVPEKLVKTSQTKLSEEAETHDKGKELLKETRKESLRDTADESSPRSLKLEPQKTAGSHTGRKESSHENHKESPKKKAPVKHDGSHTAGIGSPKSATPASHKDGASTHKDGASTHKDGVSTGQHAGDQKPVGTPTSHATGSSKIIEPHSSGKPPVSPHTAGTDQRKEATPRSGGSTPHTAGTDQRKEATTPRSGGSKDLDSARSVAEELDFDDNEDIVSTGRPTPRVDLHASTKETPRRREETKKIMSETSLKDATGKPNQRALESGEASSTEHIEPLAKKSKGKVASDSKLDRIAENDENSQNGGKTDQKMENDFSTPRPKARKSGILDSKPIKKEDQGGNQEGKEELKSPRLQSHSSSKFDEIFKTSARSDGEIKAAMSRKTNTDRYTEGGDDRASSDRKDPSDRQLQSGAERNQQTEPTEEARTKAKSSLQSESEATMHKSAQINENGYGSQTSLRSGDKDLGSPSAPVPSPRKSASSRLSEDDVPKPSPRVRRDVKGKSSLKSKEKLPDAKSLRDWNHCTSKGCFFYEEEEIVSHIYQLVLKEDSSVYLSAHPIQEPSCLSLPSQEPVDTALFVLDNRGRVVTFTELRDIQGTFGVKCDLEAGEYQILPYTTGCRFKQRSEQNQHNMKESKLVKKDKEDKLVITSAFRKALEDIFDLCDLDNNGTMSRDEFNWFNLRTSGEELGEDEWEVVEERTQLEDGEITKQGFIELNEMEAEDANGDVGDLWITLTSMGLNKALMMDEACPYRLDVYTQGRKKPSLKVTGIESVEKREFLVEICQSLIEKAGEPTKIRNMKDLYTYTYKNDHWATVVIDNRSRSSINLEVDCSRSRNVTSNHDKLDYTVEIDPQNTAVAHHLMPRSELSDWTVSCTETIHK